MARNLIPGNFSFFRMPSIIDEVDDLLSFSQADTANGLSISEDDEHIHIDAAIPGINPEDIEVTHDQGMLWIRGEAHAEEKDKKRKFYRRATQAFSYRVAVPTEVDPNAEPEASYANGVIHITLTKSSQSQPKKLTIRMNKTNGKREKEGSK